MPDYQQNKVKNKKLFYFFIDGLGIGKNDQNNPVSDLFRKSLNGHLLSDIAEPFIFEGGAAVPVDPVQGVPGLPQSATGQTSLYTGINAQKILGYHLTAIPNKKLIRLIRERNILKILKNRGISVTSANMYSEEYFKSRMQMKKNMFPVSTLSIQTADISFRMINEYQQGKALFADITNRLINEKGYDIDLISPEEGAERAKNILDEYDSVFYEYFMTDIYGHKRNRDAMELRKNELNLFLEKLIELTKNDPDTSILIVSDHGNAEDFSTGDHTLNKVPFILFTRDRTAAEKALKCKRLTDTYYFVLDYFGITL